MHSTMSAQAFPCTVIDWRVRLANERHRAMARVEFEEAMHHASVKLLLALAATLVVVAVGWHLSGRESWPLRNFPPATSGPIVCFGDSLVAGIGAESAAESYPAALQKQLGRQVVAYGVPGDGAADGWRRLQELPGLRGAVVIVTLGGNDILQHRPWPETATALGNIFSELQQRGALVVYTGVDHPLAPRLRGRQRALCREHGVLFVPQVLNGILANPRLVADPVHPNGDGYRIMAERVGAALAAKHIVAPADRG